MDAYDAVISRRSIREFTEEPVPADLIQRLMRGAMQAPSAGNEQPWQFVIITERQKLLELHTLLRFEKALQTTPCAILICGDTAFETHKGFLPQDCAAAAQNILICAHSFGLGAVWIGIHPSSEKEKGIQSLFEIPESVIPVSLVVLGYPAEKKAPIDRYDANRLHHNSWHHRVPHLII
ncbi:MAG: nitroreductase family protein [Spirochaetia bacterium]